MALQRTECRLAAQAPSRRPLAGPSSFKPPVTPQRPGQLQRRPSARAPLLLTDRRKPLTRAAIERMYPPIAGRKPELTLFETSSPDSAHWYITWHDEAGREIATLDHILQAHVDGSYELHLHNVWLAPAARGNGTGKAIQDAQVELLRTLSSHPKARVTLRAGALEHDLTSRHQNGTDFWARDFDFADQHGARSGVVSYPPRSLQEDEVPLGVRDLTLQQRTFRAWVKREQGRLLPKDAALAEQLIEQSKRWRTPSDIRSMGAGLDLTVEFQGAPIRCDVGRAFLLTAAPEWDGVKFVNGRTATPRAT